MKKEIVLLLLVSFIALNLINIVFISIIFSSTFNKITGEVGRFGYVSLFIEGLMQIYILEPENTTYNFSIGENYTLNLNTSSGFNASQWWYTLEDLRHNLVVSQDNNFTPNATFNAVRWENKLTVFARATQDGSVFNKSVEFFIYIPNSAPQIHEMEDEIFVCEGDYLSFFFNTTDIDESIPASHISTTPPFYTTFSRRHNLTVSIYEIFSGTLSKRWLDESTLGSKTYEETITVDDGEYSDTEDINITLIEINNAPTIVPIGVQTIWGYGENRTFLYQVGADDEEDGSVDERNLTLNLTIFNSSGGIINLFNIDELGIINFTANESDFGIYNITVRVTDNGLKVYHPNLTNVCLQNHSNKTSEINFSLTVTDENRAPYITSYWPLELNLTVYEGDALYFNVTMYDPDWSPVDSYWYFDNRFVEFDSGLSNGTFSELKYYFGYNDAGNRTIRVNVTDGNLSSSYDSFVWNIIVIDKEPPAGTGAGGGGGGTGGTPSCYEKWGCSDWNECKNSKEALDLKTLGDGKYSLIKEDCDKNKWTNEYCGYQIRKCSDLFYCNITDNKPKDIQACYYTENPNCHDNIKNCHDGSCEILADCGGPCKQCPTCSDKTRNQGEEGIDCGGPCDRQCKIIEKPAVKKTPFRYFLVLLILILLIIIIVISIKYLRFIKAHKSRQNI